MSPMRLLLHFGLIFVTCVTYGIASEFRNWPTMVFKKGETALIPCLPHGDANAYFWRKGIWFNVSENIASIVHGISDNSEKFEVLPNGSLIINHMTTNDEGTYYCRIASEVNECHGEVTVYLEVTSDQLDLSVKECNSQPICSMIVVPLSEITLTCTANFVSDSMTLKWYSGPNELSGEIITLKDSEKKLSSTIRLTFTGPTILTCEAAGIALSRSITYIQLDKTDDTTETSSPQVVIWIIPIAILSVVCIGLFLFLLFNRKVCKSTESLGMDGDGKGHTSKEADEEKQNFLKTDKQKLTPEVQKLQSDKQKLTEELQKLQTDEQKLTEEVQKLQTDKQKLTEEVQKLQTDKQKLTPEVQKLQTDKQKLTEEVQKLQTDKQKLTEEVQKLQSDKQKLTPEVQKLQICRAVTCCLDPSNKNMKIKKINYMITYNHILEIALTDNAGRDSKIFQNILRGINSCIFVCGFSFSRKEDNGSFAGTVQDFFVHLKKHLPSFKFQVSMKVIERDSRGDYVYVDPARVGDQERTITVGKRIAIKTFNIESEEDLRTITSLTPLRHFDKDHYSVVSFYTDKGSLSLSFIEDVGRIKNCIEDKIDDSFDNFLVQVTRLKNSVITLIVNCDRGNQGERDKLITEQESVMNYLASIHTGRKG
ncbi:Nuclear mitotic apparatus protein 1 [Holothuria leucospilota]|uniref:Nuclear mitotic apparatus protein 1 n=1 Tax=Holothuria leucospilota TaxID=206669 RepID=A0A9Q1H7N0_HOLLE|nr:Nuclear mitotic apparatus protein 1 [Holothuria leucospilota]